MSNQEQFEFWCLRYPNGDFVDIDPNSGGYPYPTNFLRCYHFETKEKAEEYREHFKEFQVLKIKVEITEFEYPIQKE